MQHEWREEKYLHDIGGKDRKKEITRKNKA
jgi:hypothetical protein